MREMMYNIIKNSYTISNVFFYPISRKHRIFIQLNEKTLYIGFEEKKCNTFKPLKTNKLNPFFEYLDPILKEFDYDTLCLIPHDYPSRKIYAKCFYGIGNHLNKNLLECNNLFIMSSIHNEGDYMVVDANYGELIKMNNYNKPLKEVDLLCPF